MLLLALSLLSPPARAACPDGTSPTELAAALERAEQAYARVDATSYRAELRAIRESLPCLQVRIDPLLAARLHRAEGLGAFLDGNDDRARLAFAAARNLEPTFRFPDDMIPPEAVERQHYQAVPLDVGRNDPAPVPVNGVLVFDGRPSGSRPVAWPTIFQLEQATQVVETDYLWLEDPLPAYLAEEPVKPRGPRTGAWVLGGISAGAGLTGLGMWGWAWALYPKACKASSESFDAQFCRDTVVPLGKVGGAMAIGGGVGVLGATGWLLLDGSGPRVGIQGRW